MLHLYLKINTLFFISVKINTPFRFIVFADFKLKKDTGDMFAKKVNIIQYIRMNCLVDCSDNIMINNKKWY